MAMWARRTAPTKMMDPPRTRLGELIRKKEFKGISLGVRRVTWTTDMQLEADKREKI